MRRIKVGKYFYLDEFVDPYTYFKEQANGMYLMDHNLFTIADKLRELHGYPIYINTWWKFYKAKKDYFTIDDIIKKIEGSEVISKWSGYRSKRCKIGSRYSAHKVGKAIDPKGYEINLFNIVKFNAKEFYNIGLRRLEDPNITHGWLHMDTLERNTKPNSIRVVNLTKSTETIFIKQ